MQSPKRITIDDPEVGGTYEVERLEGGDLLLRKPLTTVDEILGRHSGRLLTEEEFEREFGDLPRDGEG